MLLEPAPTSFDLRFELGRTPIRVHVGFWIFSAILGWNLLKTPGANGMLLLGMWIACCFVSILLHEFGHIIAGRLFGSNGYIVLYTFGGLAVGSRDQDKRWQRVVVSLAGPGIQLALYGILWLALNYVIKVKILEWNLYAIYFYDLMMWINLIWPLFNLLPVWPLDGGMVSREICEAASARNGLKISLIISMLLAGFIAVNSFAMMNQREIVPWLGTKSWYGVLLFGSLAYESYQLLQQVINRPWHGDYWQD